METQLIFEMAVQSIGVLFTLSLGILLVWHMNKSGGKLTPNEAGKVIVMIMFVYAMIVNGSREVGTPLVFDVNIIMILLGAVLGLAGIENWKDIQDKKNDNGGKSSNG